MRLHCLNVSVNKTRSKDTVKQSKERIPSPSHSQAASRVCSSLCSIAAKCHILRQKLNMALFMIPVSSECCLGSNGSLKLVLYLFSKWCLPRNTCPHLGCPIILKEIGVHCLQVYYTYIYTHMQTFY